jgi:hypothetical protein
MVGFMNDQSQVVESIPVEAAPAVTAQAEKVAEPKIEPKSEPRIEQEPLATLRAIGLRWADVGLGSSKALLQRGARLLEDAAVKLGALQERLQSGQVAAAA